MADHYKISSWDHLAVRFQRVVWHHDHPDEARAWLSEVDESGLERRKVNEFDDGRLEFADEIQETEYTTLGDQVMPSIEEIDSLAEFTATPIGPEDFEEAWLRATTQNGPFILEIAPVDWEHPLELGRVESLATLLLEMQPATGWKVLRGRRTVIRVTGSASAEVAPAIRRAIQDAVRVPFRIVVRKTAS